MNNVIDDADLCSSEQCVIFSLWSLFWWLEVINWALWTCQCTGLRCLSAQGIWWMTYWCRAITWHVSGPSRNRDLLLDGKSAHTKHSPRLTDNRLFQSSWSHVGFVEAKTVLKVLFLRLPVQMDSYHLTSGRTNWSSLGRGSAGHAEFFFAGPFILNKAGWTAPKLNQYANNPCVLLEPWWVMQDAGHLTNRGFFHDNGCFDNMPLMPGCCICNGALCYGLLHYTQPLLSSLLLKV